MVVDTQFDRVNAEIVANLFDKGFLTSNYLPTVTDIKAVESALTLRFPTPTIVIHKASSFEWKIMKGERFLKTVSFAFHKNQETYRYLNINFDVWYIRGNPTEDEWKEILAPLSLGD